MLIGLSIFSFLEKALARLSAKKEMARDRYKAGRFWGLLGAESVTKGMLSMRRSVASSQPPSYIYINPQASLCC